VEYEDNKQCILLTVKPARYRPIAFSGVEYVRIGSYTKKLKDHYEQLRALWMILSSECYEAMVVADHLSAQETLSLLRFDDYFELGKQPRPETVDDILALLASERLIDMSDDGEYSITSLGGLLFARDIDKLEPIKRKAIRLVFYKGENRTAAIREFPGKRGYASGFQGLLKFLVGSLPSSEEIKEAIRRDVPVYPEIALREIIANALIHQDFMVRGAGPMIEVFSNRIEITNPGEPLIDINRFLGRRPCLEMIDWPASCGD